MARLLLCALLLLALLPWNLAAQNTDLEQAEALQKTVKKALAQAEPSIACLLIARGELPQRLDGPTSGPGHPELADPAHVPESFGSGVVIDPKGLILTMSYGTPRQSSFASPVIDQAMPMSTPPICAATWPYCGCAMSARFPSRPYLLEMPPTSSAGSSF
jgi:hypothetical protein